MHSYLSSLGWSPTNPRMVTHQKEVYYRLGFWQINFTDKKHPVTAAMDGHLPFLGWSPTNPRMVNYQKEVHYRLGIWYLDLLHAMLCGVPTPISYVRCPHPNKACAVSPPQ